MMKIQLWSVGKAHEPYIKTGVEEFTKRLNKYFSAEWEIIPTPKNAAMLSQMDLKKQEGKTITDWL
jgi:23S rRNA (pseudouridine1915-N3)-methyltransferase